MKGIAFHWEPPHLDIYSGMDPYASAWKTLCSTFGLNIAVIGDSFPWGGNEEHHTSLEDFLAAHPNETVVYADASGSNDGNIVAADWLVFGPASGWATPPAGATWTYSPSPPGGYHAIHLAHVAVHIGAS